MRKDVVVFSVKLNSDEAARFDKARAKQERSRNFIAKKLILQWLDSIGE